MIKLFQEIRIHDEQQLHPILEAATCREEAWRGITWVTCFCQRHHVQESSAGKQGTGVSLGGKSQNFL